MKEESVFWMGGRPGTRQAASEPPVPAALESGVLAACRAQGLAPEDFVAALGGYGSWLVHFRRDGQRQRIVWNGRDQTLVLQAALRSGGWADAREVAVPGADAASFAEAIAGLLKASQRA